MNVDILKTVLTDASELTASLPENIRPVAFAKTFDVLLADRAESMTRGRRVEQDRRRPRRRVAGYAQRIGPKSALTELLDAGYFSSARSLPEVQAHLRDSYGHDYGSNELSISLLRLIRDGRLNREKNLAGQYEYQGKGREHGAPHEPLRPTKPHRRLLTDGGRG